MLMRIATLTAAVAALALAPAAAVAAPAAPADSVSVCNEAENSPRGGYVVTGGREDPEPARVPARLADARRQRARRRSRARWRSAPRRCACAARRTMAPATVAATS